MAKYKFEKPSGSKNVPEYFTKFTETMSLWLEQLDDKITEMTTTIRAEIKDVDTKADRALGLAQTNADAIAELQQNVFGLQRKCDGLQAENKRLENQCDALDSYGRRENIVIRGIPEPDGEDESRCIQAVRDMFVNVLHLDRNIVNRMVFARCHRLGKPDDTQNRHFNRPVIVRFLDYNERRRVWEQRFHINAEHRAYSLCENFANNVDFRRRLLYPVFRKAKVSEHHKNVSLKADKLKIDDVTYQIDDNEDSLPADLKLEQFGHKSNGQWIVFGGIHSKYHYLSNYYPSQFKYNNIIYESAEQCYQHCKAVQYQADETSRNILGAQSPSEAKRLGSKFDKFDKKDWDNRKETVMSNILRAKFAARTDLGEKLKNTTGKSLAEAGRSKTFAIGVTLNSKNLFDTTKWNLTTGNILGKCLMKIRDELN